MVGIFCRLSRWKSFAKRSTSSLPFTKTVILPKTLYEPFLTVSQEEEIRNSDTFSGLYEKQFKDPTRKDLFILHDGPPYANGDPHLGHATNKIYKDIICRYQYLLGKKIHFVPGWDCHGLPIEAKAVSETSSNDPIIRRSTAHEFSLKTIDIQRKSFQSWGLLCDWKKPYLTSDISYVIEELKAFKELFDKGLLYRDFLPVFWSLDYQTALAEAELEYHEHTSPSIYVKFPVVGKFLDYDNCYLLVWTTTPWTLNSNQAICYAKNEMLCIVQIENEDGFFLIAQPRFEELRKIFPTMKLVKTFSSDTFKNLKYSNPMNPLQIRSVLDAPEVTMHKGTGLVHSAPNHGKEDFAIAVRHGIRPDPSLVGNDGCFNDLNESSLVGKFVLDEGNDAIISMWKDYIIWKGEYQHNYPYDWRSKKPVITIPSQQWFLDTNKLQDGCLKALTDVNFYPSFAENRLKIDLSVLFQWCISRQRVWGVPIPVFFETSDKSLKPILTDNMFSHLLDVFEHQGLSAWWANPVSDLLPPEMKDDAHKFKKGTDILDIWLDSGLSWRCALPPGVKADLYIEGQDQFRGWFKSSLVTSIALTGQAPYKNIAVHGFVLDENGKKMSKSEGNVVDPRHLVLGSETNNIPAFGSDVLRWWVCQKSAHSGNTRFSIQQMKACKEEVAKIRRIFKFFFGCLDDFSDADILPQTEWMTTDRLMLNVVQSAVAKCEDYMDKFDVQETGNVINDLVVEDLSAIFLDAAKNRLYSYPRDSKERRSAQSAFYETLPLLHQMCWPILPHSMEHAKRFFPKELISWELCTPKLNEDSLEDYLFLKNVRSKIHHELKIPKKIIRSNVIVFADESWWNRLKSITEAELANFFGVANARLGKFGYQSRTDKEENVPSEPFDIELSPSHHYRCPRCLKFKSPINNELCSFCKDIISKYYTT